ncbi:hypothetical protein ACRE1U_03165 [Helicobacter himalayensis]|uniref:hypothetical protein n=1 Tax=Helicobacter himalayensis TaxID=1591088 RepID=UPI003D6F51C1
MSVTSPFFSIIIPTYNVERYIARCLEFFLKFFLVLKPVGSIWLKKNYKIYLSRV